MDDKKSNIYVMCSFSKFDKIMIPIINDDVKKYIRNEDIDIITKENTIIYRFEYKEIYELYILYIVNNISSQVNIDTHTTHLNIFNTIRIVKKYIGLPIQSKNIDIIISSWLEEKWNDSWKNLSRFKDFSSFIIHKRRWPYYNCSSVQWKNINKRIKDADYPEKMIDMLDPIPNATNKTLYPNISNILGKYTIKQQEKIILDKVHNFKYIKSINNSEYMDIKHVLGVMTLLEEIKMYFPLLAYIYVLCTSLNSAHIIKYKKFWEIIEIIYKCHIHEYMSKNNYDILIAYITYYAVYTMRQEQLITFNIYPEDSRMIYTLEEANNIKNFSEISFEYNPMIHIMPCNNYKTSMLIYYIGTKDRYINSLDKFKKRFNWITRNALYNIDLHKFNACVSGSILIPCVATSPLEKRFKGHNMFHYLLEQEIQDLKNSDYFIANEKEISKNIDIDNSYIDDVDYTILYQLFNNISIFKPWQNKIIDNRGNIEIERDEFLNYIECYYPSYRSLLKSDYDNIIKTFAYEDSKYEIIKKNDMDEIFNWDKRRPFLKNTKKVKMVRTRNYLERKRISKRNFESKIKGTEAQRKALTALPSASVCKADLKNLQQNIKVFEKKTFKQRAEPQILIQNIKDDESSFKSGKPRAGRLPLMTKSFSSKTFESDSSLGLMSDTDSDSLSDASDGTDIEISDKFSFKDDVKKTETQKNNINKISDIDISIHITNLNSFKKLAYKLFEEIKENTKQYGKIYITKIITKSIFKYVINGPGLVRPIDMFPVFKSPENLTKGYYFDVVQMFYNGNTVKLFHNCVTALLTGIIHRKKWYSCNKIPGDSDLKYISRGYTPIYNNNEIKVLTEYIKTEDRWNRHIEQGSNATITGHVGVNHTFFYPDSFQSGIRYELDPRKKWTKNINYMNNIVTIDNVPFVITIGKQSTVIIEIPYLNESRNSISVPSKILLNNILKIN